MAYQYGAGGVGRGREPRINGGGRRDMQGELLYCAKFENRGH